MLLLKKADSALLIKTPQQFEKDVSDIFGGVCVWNQVQYYSDIYHGKIWKEMLEFICGQPTSEVLDERDYLAMGKLIPIGETQSSACCHYYITMENVYRTLFCKDDFFAKQQEYRCVANRGILSKPGCFKYSNRSEMELYSKSDFLNGITTMRGANR